MYACIYIFIIYTHAHLSHEGRLGAGGSRYCSAVTAFAAERISAASFVRFAASVTECVCGDGDGRAPNASKGTTDIYRYMHIYI